MDHDKPPQQFADIARLVEGEPTLSQAASLTRALEAIPDLQRWLKTHRSRVVAELRATHSRDEIAEHLNCKPQRVSDIIQGHSRQRGPRRTVKPGA